MIQSYLVYIFLIIWPFQWDKDVKIRKVRFEFMAPNHWSSFCYPHWDLIILIDKPSEQNEFFIQVFHTFTEYILDGTLQIYLKFQIFLEWNMFFVCILWIKLFFRNFWCFSIKYKYRKNVDRSEELLSQWQITFKVFSLSIFHWFSNKHGRK